MEEEIGKVVKTELQTPMSWSYSSRREWSTMSNPEGRLRNSSLNRNPWTWHWGGCHQRPSEGSFSGVYGAEPKWEGVKKEAGEEQVKITWAGRVCQGIGGEGQKRNKTVLAKGGWVNGRSFRNGGDRGTFDGRLKGAWEEKRVDSTVEKHEIITSSSSTYIEPSVFRALHINHLVVIITTTL